MKQSCDSAYSVRLPGHVEGPTLELAEMLEKDGHESRDVLCCLFGCTLIKETS